MEPQECEAKALVLPEHVVWRRMPESTILLNVQTGIYHELNQTGAEIFGLLVNGSTVEEVADRLASAYGVSTQAALADVRGLCRELEWEGVVSRTP